jgi:phage gp29-like protein
MEDQEIEIMVLQALTALGKGTAEEVVKKLEQLYPDLPNKEVIGGTHKILTDLFAQDKIAGIDSEGTIVYLLK